ncbi:zinc finger BED domain-containing protein RICESLEEPER 1-like [Curcuma longa]|uniref:zinc finger BED domain-containing protein RICESLEEPER 1-like n=1 Tax=Curcuma longa TaxID=136217 RepID=UPI003D9EE64A
MQDGLSEIQDIIFNVRESAKHITASETRVTIFSEISKQLKLSSKKLVLDCCTRWNATFCMLSAALEFKDVFPRYAARDATYTFLPSEEDWKKVSVVCSFLKEFNEVTHLISGSEYPTSNLFLTELYTIKKLLNEVSAIEGSFMTEMDNKMKAKFDKYWGDSNLLISIAAVLDLRNKMKLIEWCFLKIYFVSDAIEHISMIHEILHMLYNEYVEAHEASVGNNNVQGETQRESSIGQSNLNGRGKGKVRAQFSNYIKNVNSVEQVKSELDVYLDERLFASGLDSKLIHGRTYVVFVGRQPGIYDTWLEASRQVNGFKGAIHQSFKSREEAEKAFQQNVNKNSTSTSVSSTQNQVSNTTSASVSSSSSKRKLSRLEKLSKMKEALETLEELKQQIEALHFNDDED